MIRSFAKALSSSVRSHLADPVDEPGKSGKRKNAIVPAKKLAAPSSMKSHLHPAIPWTLSRPANIPAARRPEMAVARTRPE
jgi:hypothetical protein